MLFRDIGESEETRFVNRRHDPGYIDSRGAGHAIFTARAKSDGFARQRGKELVRGFHFTLREGASVYGCDCVINVHGFFHSAENGVDVRIREHPPDSKIGDGMGADIACEADITYMLVDKPAEGEELS